MYGGRGPTKEIVQESVIDDDDNSSSYFPMGYAQSKYIGKNISTPALKELYFDSNNN